MPATDSDIAALTLLLGREPRGAFDIVVRDDAGAPVVIRNAPLLDDGTPMPTRYWLIGREAIARLLAGGFQGSDVGQAADFRRAVRRPQHQPAGIVFGDAALKRFPILKVDGDLHPAIEMLQGILELGS